MKTMISVLASAFLLSAGVAMAEETKPVPAPASTASTAKPAKMKHAAVHSDKSKKCSADADAKNLHGKERKTFRKACMKAAA
jgi:hypothetical protein